MQRPGSRVGLGGSEAGRYIQVSHVRVLWLSSSCGGLQLVVVSLSSEGSSTTPQPDTPLTTTHNHAHRHPHARLTPQRHHRPHTQVLLTAKEVATALAYLHSMRVVHGDLKSANVMLRGAPLTPTDDRGFEAKVNFR